MCLTDRGSRVARSVADILFYVYLIFYMSRYFLKNSKILSLSILKLFKFHLTLFQAKNGGSFLFSGNTGRP